jgi:hypothetical protein
MPRQLLTALALVIVLGSPRPASADITAFFGLSPSPERHMARGFAIGFGLLVIGFEFEYANLSEDELEGIPGLQTGSGNILLQTPIEVSGFSFYGTAGAGMYRERLMIRQETHFASNIGGGIKIRLVGPLRVRADYRVFRLQGDPLHETYQRFYVGGNLAF